MKIAIVGTGYVGSVTAVCLAENGHQIICVDKDEHKVQELSKGRPIIYEPGLEKLLLRNIKKQSIEFTSSIRKAVAKSEIIFMTVGTPSAADGSADLSQLEQAVREVSRAIEEPKIIVNKSTVPVGTHQKVREWVSRVTKLHVEVVSNPEFLREGSALEDFLHPERVVIGTKRKDVFQKIMQLYRPFVENPEQILWMDPVSAELTKYACNAFLATRISFMNDLSGLCEKVGGDILSIRQGMSLDSRIGSHFLNAGIGYGGSCFPKDIRALLKTAQDYKSPLSVVAAADAVNEKQKRVLLPALFRHLGSRPHSKKVALWGLSFKPHTDDIRESPALVLAEELLERGIAVSAYDPVAMPRVREMETEIELCEDPYEALRDASALVVATEWPQFQEPDFSLIGLRMKEKAIFDGRNIFSPEVMREAGFRYWSIGRSPKIVELPGAADSRLGAFLPDETTAATDRVRA